MSSEEQNKALIRRFDEEISTKRSKKATSRRWMNGLPKTMQITLPPPFPLEAGRDGLKQAFRMFWEGTLGTHTIEDQIAEGDKSSRACGRTGDTRVSWRESLQPGTRWT